MNEQDPTRLSANTNGSAGPARSIPMVADRMNSRDLFHGTREIVITHGEDAYRLRLTAQNKLILTK